MAACSCPVHSARVTGAATRRRRSSIEDTTRTRRAFPTSTTSTSSKAARETERCTAGELVRTRQTRL